jgi:hypothetical protein
LTAMAADGNVMNRLTNWRWINAIPNAIRNQ